MSVETGIGVVPRDHVVQFYAHDDELVSSVAQFLIDGLLDGETVIVVATPAHTASFESAIAGAGIDVRRAQSVGTFVTVDAADALSRFFVNVRLDADAFGVDIGGLIERALKSGRRVRAYGEMVALLWEAGDVAAAIELEALWNDLGRVLPFSLFCAYRADPVGGDERVDSFRHVCHLHSAVVAPSPVCASAVNAFVVARAEDARSFPCELHSPTLARRFVADTLTTWGLASLVADASIVVAELATNAVLHARSEFVVAVSSDDDVVRMSVRDGSPLLPAVRVANPRSICGRGLVLVAAVASQWGTELLGDGKVVWAELALH